MAIKKEETSFEDIKEVRDHYEDYPYPYRNPESEDKMLYYTMGESLQELNHYLYRGKQNFENFRCLVAGGGTGDSSTYLGEQLKNYPGAEIIYVDFSKASMEIAQKRAERRGLKNIKFIYDSIFNIPKLDLGKFDFVNCSGVLHHLPSPPEGLKILADSLKESGGMSLMVYAKYGRTGVYHLQEAIRMVNQSASSRQEEVARAKTILSNLPATNWYARGGELFSDVQQFGDIGIYDLFLHKQDRCYSLPELFEFAEGAGLNFIDFSDPNTRIGLFPENYIKDQDLLAKVKALGDRKAWAISEILVGDIIKHCFYVSKEKNTTAKIENLDNVPYFYYCDGAGVLSTIENNAAAGKILSFTLNPNGVLRKNLNVSIPISEFTLPFIKHMKEQTKSLREIFDAARAELGKDIEDSVLIEDFKKTFDPFFKTNLMFLRDKSVNIKPLELKHG